MMTGALYESYAKPIRHYSYFHYPNPTTVYYLKYTGTVIDYGASLLVSWIAQK